MVSSAKLPQTFTPEEYLELEQTSTRKSEYFSGEIFMMAGGSPNHNRISLNVSARLSLGLEGKRCETFNSDQRLYITKNGLFTYPDAMVVCGQIEFDQRDRDAITNPVVVVEVLSPSTQDYDRGGKFELYRDIGSFREYVLVHQDKVHIEHYHKDNADRWVLTEIKDIEATLKFYAIDFELSVGRIYERVDWLL